MRIIPARTEFSLFKLCVLLLSAASFTGDLAVAQQLDTTHSTLSDASEIAVTVNNFTRAATDLEMSKYQSLAGGVNTFYHFREPTPIDNQPTIRMNRDTLYSAAVVDISEGATLTLPEAGNRYMSAMIVNQDHYVNKVFKGAGTYTLDMATFDTPYVVVFMRTLVDAENPEDIAEVNALQDQFVINSASARTFIQPPYDEDDIQGIITVLGQMVPYIAGATGVFGTKDEVDGFQHFIGTALGWGGLPEGEAYYLNEAPGLSDGKFAVTVPADIPVGQFWSLSVYNAEGFFEYNPLNAYSVNSITGTRNDDGSMTVHFGGCEDGRVNCLPISEGWNFITRMYEPSQGIIDGIWTFPEIVAVD